MTRARARLGRGLALLAIGGALVVMARSDDRSPRPSSTVANPAAGVDQLRIRITAQGHLLDLRYRIVDPARAGSLLAKQTTAYVLHARSGRRLAVPTTPKAGALRTTGVPRAGRSYFALFANPHGLVRRGDHVSVVLGELSAELVVQ